MARPTGTFKQDNHARVLWGEAFDAIPKSVWATAAWHLANLASGEADRDGAAANRFLEEILALGQNGILPEGQAARARKALERGGARIPDQG